jgi:glucose-1-phosphate adenylyltransferase
VFDNPERRGEATESMISAGCIVSGASVKRSLIFSNCKVHSYSRITDTLILPECEIHDGCRIHNAIIDRGCQIPENTQIGIDQDEDRARGFRVTEGGHTLVTPGMLAQPLHHTR